MNCSKCGNMTCTCNECKQCKGVLICRCCKECKSYPCKCCPNCHKYPCNCCFKCRRDKSYCYCDSNTCKIRFGPFN